jgi:hypothetical protein
MSAEGYLAWSPEAYVEGFEDAIDGLARTGCIRSDVDTGFLVEFFELMGLSDEARNSVRDILRRQLPK